jgi:cell division protein FtsL
MDDLKLRNSGTDRERSVPSKPVVTARRRYQMRPVFFHMGPAALTICSVLLIALMAVLYLSQVGQAVAANQQLQSMRTQQATLTRQNQDLAAVIAHERSPQYIMQQAQKMGLVPANPNNVQMITIPNLQPLRHQNSILQP